MIECGLINRKEKKVKKREKDDQTIDNSQVTDQNDTVLVLSDG